MDYYQVLRKNLGHLTEVLMFVVARGRSPRSVPYGHNCCSIDLCWVGTWLLVSDLWCRLLAISQQQYLPVGL